MTEWKPMTGLRFSSYEASDKGGIRSIDRTVAGRQLKGRQLSTRVSNRGYVLVDLTGDDGRRVTRSVHTLILGTFAGQCPPGMEARHLDDNPLNNEAVNLAWGTKRENNGDKVRNGNRSGPPPPKLCVRCGAPFAGNGKRCHACVVWIGEKAAELLTAGTSLADACHQLEYPSPEGLHTLAVKYGGYGAQPVAGRSWLRRVIVAVRDRLWRGDGP